MNNYKKQIIYIVLSFSMIFSVIGLIILPTINNIFTIKEEIDSQKKALELRYQNGFHITKLTKEYGTIKNEIKTLQDIFFDESEENILKFRNDFSFWVAEHDLILEDFKLLEIKKAEKYSYKVIPLKLTVSGSYPEILRLLRNLEKMENFINIYSLQLTSSGEKISAEFEFTEERALDNKTLNLSIEANTYWKEDKL